MTGSELPVRAAPKGHSTDRSMEEQPNETGIGTWGVSLVWR